MYLTSQYASNHRTLHASPKKEITLRHFASLHAFRYVHDSSDPTIDPKKTTPQKTKTRRTMSEPTMPPNLTLIVAATPKNGIGKNGALPWPMLKKEMAYFARVTKRVPKPASSPNSASPSNDDEPPAKLQNAVLMGRKTWDSIPPRFRPLKDRTNIVISSQPRSALPGVTDEVIVSSSILSALQDLEAGVKEGKVPGVGRVFVIGGARVYEGALGLECARSVLLTRLGKEFECDTFFPDLGESGEGWVQRGRGELEEFVGEEVQEGGLVEEGVGFEFQLWER